MTVVRSIAIVLIAALLGGVVLAHDEVSKARGKGRPERSKNGNYVLNFAGALAGQGAAVVTTSTVTMTAELKRDEGESLQLKAELTIDGAYFKGEGTLGGKKVTIKGRLDAAKASRLVATYTTHDNRRGRIVGTLPDDKGDDKWNDRK